MSVLQIGNFTYKKDDKGLWKSEVTNPYQLLKPILRKEYHDLPRYKISLEIEKELKDEYNNQVIKNSVLEIVNQLKETIQ